MRKARGGWGRQERCEGREESCRKEVWGGRRGGERNKERMERVYGIRKEK